MRPMNLVDCCSMCCVCSIDRLGFQLSFVWFCLSWGVAPGEGWLVTEGHEGHEGQAEGRFHFVTFVSFCEIASLGSPTWRIASAEGNGGWRPIRCQEPINPS